MDCLPIDEVLPELGRGLRESPCVVLEAPPGAGKTTRVPWHLTEHLGLGKVLVAEPRRLAAKLAAERVAHELGESVGGAVGYSVRMEHVADAKTRVLYLTDGVLLRQLLTNPTLAGTGCVVLDEFHERRLQSDTCLALLRRLQQRERPDLKLLVMSATLDAESVSSFLGHCPRVRSEGRSYPVEITHLARPDDRPLERQVSSAVRELLQKTSGDLLVFLPGAAEIRAAKAALDPLAEERGLLLAPLHGDLMLREQTEAVRRHRLRKVVLATNVAESSITIDNVTGVIDSGLARVLIHDAWSGMDQLGLHRVSQASAIQRAGRAGRTGPGQVLRLYTRGEFEARARSEAPEVTRLDLSETLLLLKSNSRFALEELAWLTPPKASSLEAAEALLRELGATDPGGRLNELGRRLLAFPLHPRLARVVVEGERRGVEDGAALIAALLSERDIRRAKRSFLDQRGGHDGDGDSDVLELVELYREAEERGFDGHALRQLDLDRHSTLQVQSTHKRLRSLVEATGEAAEGAQESDEALLMSIMTGFIDRLAQRASTGRGLLLANGTVAELADESVVHRAPLMVAVQASQHGNEPRRRGKTLVRVASRVDESWLFDCYIESLTETEDHEYNQGNERVERVSRIRFGKITLDERRDRAAPGRASGEVLYRAALAKGLHAFDPEGRLDRLVARLRTLREQFPERDFSALGELSPETLLLEACSQVSSLPELAERGLSDQAWALLPVELSALLEAQVPESIALPGGRRLSVVYRAGQEPYVESRLQDFFSMTETPAICGGRLPLLVHLLAPNKRAVQVTRDLAGFWERHYPALRKQLMRRYPKHAWPEDGRTASPPAPRALR